MNVPPLRSFDDGRAEAVIVDRTLPEPLVRDELQAVASMLRSRYPEHSPAALQRLVTDVYERLANQARMRAHLIPLTLNHCRRVLSEGALAQSKATAHNDFGRPTDVPAPPGAEFVDAAV